MAEMDNTEAIRGWLDVPAGFAEEFGDEGDFARRTLLNPILFDLLGDVRGKTILDAGCGQGYLSRLLARRGARVTGVDPATPLIDYAARRELAEPQGIRYVEADLCSFRIQGPAYDIVIANMVLMDIPDYLGALDTCFGCLRDGGQLICSLTHPCFEGPDAEYREHGAVAVREYFAEYTIAQRWGARFHRPLGRYLTAMIQRGGVIESVIEPQLDARPGPTAPRAGAQPARARLHRDGGGEGERFLHVDNQPGYLFDNL